MNLHFIFACEEPNILSERTETRICNLKFLESDASRHTGQYTLQMHIGLHTHI